MAREEDVRTALEKYKHLLEAKRDSGEFDTPLMSQDYSTFRDEALEQRVTLYERLCQSFGNFFTIALHDKDKEQLQESIATAHLDITPQQAAGFGVFASLLIIFLGILIGAMSFVFDVFGDYLMLTLLLAAGGALILKPLTKLPHYFAQRWRLAASNQMVLCVLYLVIYLRHTSNLEHAIKFAGEHLGMPLSLDLKKILWDVETGSFVTITDSLEHYLLLWKPYNLEFVESVHLIESSLYEPVEQRRIDTLEKALQVILDRTYERMLHYAHTLKSPITILHMLGVILPVLGLVLFPLIGNFLGGLVQWYHLAFLYNLALPLLVYSMGNNMLSKRPTGYGQTEITKLYPAYASYKGYVGGTFLSPAFFGLFIGGLITLISLVPLILHWTNPSYDFQLMGMSFLDYQEGRGPYGFWALLLSLFLPLGVGVGFGLYFKIKTAKLMDVTKQTEELEQQFSSGLFQLGNRIESGIPTEKAFGDVAATMAGTATGNFFRIAANNMTAYGVGLKNAIFDHNIGAILYYPSHLIESSMKVLIESARKGPHVASTSLLTISTYLDNIRKVNERLKDLMADVLSSMTSQISFLAPIIAGIVVGVGSMVVTIINLLGQQLQGLDSEGPALAGGISAIANVLNIQDVIPSYHFQIVVGIYIVEIIIILTILSTSIERGVDNTTTQHRIGNNLLRGVSLYFLVALCGVILFNILARTVGTVT